MRSLIISQFAILDHNRGVEGIFARLRMFVAAIGGFSASIDYLAIVSPDDVAAHPDSTALSAAQSTYWGVPVQTKLVSITKRPDTLWSHYGAGAFSAAEQPLQYGYAGADQVKAVAEHLDREPDLVFIMGLPAMNTVLRSKRRPRNLFFDLNDIEHWMRLRSAIQPPIRPGSFGYLAHVPALWAAERKASSIARATFVCSDLDRKYLRRVGMGPRVVTIPNALPFPPVVSPITTMPTLLFLGGYSYAPNRDGAERLVTRIWPLIQAQMPEARLIVAGKAPEQIPSFQRQPAGVEFSGFVDDLQHLYARSRVIACPIMTGGGTRVKLIEAASRGKPMVATRVGAEGLDLRDGHELLLRDDDAGFAAACVQLLRDDIMAQTLGTAARARAAQRYEVRAVEKRIAAIMQSAVGIRQSA